MQIFEIYPNYHKLTAAKEECYSHKEAIVVSDSVTEVKLPALLDHTFSRLLKAQEDVISTFQWTNATKSRSFSIAVTSGSRTGIHRGTTQQFIR
jgi:hypothetical protein